MVPKAAADFSYPAKLLGRKILAVVDKKCLLSRERKAWRRGGILLLPPGEGQDEGFRTGLFPSPFPSPQGEGNLVCIIGLNSKSIAWRKLSDASVKWRFYDFTFICDARPMTGKRP
ncbi:MAG: hypothetical protein KAU50_12960 [Candidatus Marinimicrobia bacterium]|nr:hypothetical protein [Candidatus Neomarinimicrobiota bacterium]